MVYVTFSPRQWNFQFFFTNTLKIRTTNTTAYLEYNARGAGKLSTKYTFRNWVLSLHPPQVCVLSPAMLCCVIFPLLELLCFTCSMLSAMFEAFHFRFCTRGKGKNLKNLLSCRIKEHNSSSEYSNNIARN